MLELLKKQSLKQITKLIGVIIGVMILILIVFGSNFIKIIKGPVELSSLSPDEMLNAYVEFDVDMIMDSFVETYNESENGKQTSTDMHYIIPLNQEKYFALHVGIGDLYTAEELLNDTYDYYFANTSSEPPTTWRVKGTINKLEDKYLSYYNSYLFETAGFTQEEIDTYTMPYVLDVDYIGEYNSTFMYGFLVIFLILLLCIIIYLIKGLSGMSISPIKKYIKEHEDSINIEKLEADYLNGKSIGSVKVGQIWTFFFNGAKAHVVKNEDLIWIYRQERTHRFYGLKIYQMKSLIMFTKNKKKYTATLKDSSDIDYVIETISKDHPHIVTGYSDELAKCFKKDYETFIKLPYANENNAVNNEESAATSDQEEHI